jgi:hypothetical protein
MARVNGTSVRKVVSRWSGHLLSALADDSVALAKNRIRAIGLRVLRRESLEVGDLEHREVRYVPEVFSTQGVFIQLFHEEVNNEDLAFIFGPSKQGNYTGRARSVCVKPIQYPLVSILRMCTVKFQMVDQQFSVFNGIRKGDYLQVHWRGVTNNNEIDKAIGIHLHGKAVNNLHILSYPISVSNLVHRIHSIWEVGIFEQ